MRTFELTNSLADPSNGLPVEVLRDSSDGRVRALWLPSAELVATPIPLRHFSSVALIHGSSGQIWVVSMMNHLWTEALVSKVEDFLSQHFESLSWSYLETALADAVEHAVVLHKVCLLDAQLSLLQIPCLADAIIRRWISVQAALPEIAELRSMKNELIRQIHCSADRALVQFMSLVEPNLACVSGPIGLRLNLYNYLCNTTHQRGRLQFTKAFPLLADLVCAADMKSLWRDLGRTVDDLRSPVLFLSEALEVSTASVRALNGVATADVGNYFSQHTTELLSILNAFPKEFLPKFPQHWRVLQQQYDLAKTFFGRSPAALVLVKARVAHSLRFAVQFKHQEVQLKTEDVHKVERLRAGLVQATYSYYGIDKNQALGIQRRAKISQMIDRFLGRLSWSRLLAFSRKYEKCYAAAIEKNLDAIQFLSGQTYFNFCPDGKFVTTNGWSVHCLSSSAELEADGLQLRNCLATSGYRAIFHESCFRGQTAIFAIHDQLGVARSTAEFHLSIGKTTTSESMIGFQLVQHTGHKNQPVDSATKEALESLRAQFPSPVWQTHALTGIRSIFLRNTYRVQDSGISAAHFMTSLIAFRATFKDKSDEFLNQFSGEHE